MPPLLEVRIDPAQLERIANLIGAAGKNANAGIARAINHTGDKAKTQMIRTLTVQTGLQRKTIVKALHVTRASGGGSMSYAIRSAGGDVSLKYFGARETAAGVSAAPFGHRRIFAGSFMKGGRFPKRVPLRMNGQVMQRDGGSRMPIHKVKSGLYIPNEMVSGATGAAFREVVERDLPDRLIHELMRALGS